MCPDSSRRTFPVLSRMSRLPVALRLVLALTLFTPAVPLANGKMPTANASVTEAYQDHSAFSDPSPHRSSPSLPDQATPAATPPWQIQVLDQAGGSTGPVLVAGSLAYVGRGPVVAVADISDPRAPKWVGHSDVLGGLVIDLAPAEGHLLATIRNRDQEEELLSLNLAQATAPRSVGRLDLPAMSLGLHATTKQVWLSRFHVEDGPEGGPRETLLSLSLDGAGRPGGKRSWESTGRGWHWPYPAPIVRQMGERELLVLREALDGRTDEELELWSYAVSQDGRLLSRARQSGLGPASGEGRDLFVDTRERRVYVTDTKKRLFIFDLMSDGQLLRRGMMEMSSQVGCGGLLGVGHWLLATSGCSGSPEVLIIDVTDPDRPHLGAVQRLGHSIARLAPAGEFLVASGGASGGLSLLRTDSLPTLSEVGRLEDEPIFRTIVETSAGRFAAAPRQGVVRLAGAGSADWARSELVYPLSGVTDLVGAPEGRLVASPGGAQLQVLTTEGSGLRLEQRVSLGASKRGNLVVVGRDLYVGVSGSRNGSVETENVIERWRFGPGGLEFQARSDPGADGNCFAIGDKVYVGARGNMRVLDPLSLAPLEVLNSDRATNWPCMLALRQEPGQPPRLFRTDDTSVFVQQIEGTSLTTIGAATLPRPAQQAGLQTLLDVNGDLAVLGNDGLFLVDGRSTAALRPLADLSFVSRADRYLSPFDGGSPSLAPGRRWLLSSFDLGMVLVSTAASPHQGLPVGASPEPWASPTLAPPRPRATPAATPAGPRLFLPMVIDHVQAFWPKPFAERISIGPMYRGIAGDGARAWVGDGRTVVLFEETGQAVRLLDRSANLPAPPRLLAGNADSLVAVDGARGFYVLSRPPDAAPALLGVLELPDTAMDLALGTNQAYVATAHCGIVVVDLRQPSRPRVNAVLDLPYEPRQLLVLRGRLLCFGAARPDRTTVAVASLDDPSLPAWLSQQDLPRIDLAATDGRRLFTVSPPDGVNVNVSAYTLLPGGDLVVDQPWLDALLATPEVAGKPVRTLAASPDWLLLSQHDRLVALALSPDGLARQAASWPLGPQLSLTSFAVAGRSAWALTEGNTAGSSLIGPGDLGSETQGGLLWLNLETMRDGSTASEPALAWFADTPGQAGMMARFGSVVCIWMRLEANATGIWQAVDLSDPQRAKPLGRLTMPYGVHWLLPTGTTSALALRWRSDLKLGSVLRLDLGDLLHPRVIEELSLGSSFPSSMSRSGNIVAISLDSRDNVAATSGYQLLLDNPGQRLVDHGSIPVTRGDDTFFIDKGRGYLATYGNAAAGEAGGTEPGFRYRVQVYDLESRPPRSMGYLPFEAFAFIRAGDEVFALLPSEEPDGSTRVATVLLADPPSRSSVRQVIALGDNIQLRGSPIEWDRRMLFSELTTLPDGSLVWPAFYKTRPPQFGLQQLRRSEPAGSWTAGPALDMDLEGFVSPSLSYGNGWLAFLSGWDNELGWSESASDSSRLELLRIGR